MEKKKNKTTDRVVPKQHAENDFPKYKYINSCLHPHYDRVIEFCYCLLIYFKKINKHTNTHRGQLIKGNFISDFVTHAPPEKNKKIKIKSLLSEH